MSEFQLVEGLPEEANGVKENIDDRSLTERMFFNLDESTGKLKALPIVRISGDDDYKRYNDAVLLMTEFKKNDAEYKNELKGKDVLVFGGRRRGRAGTGVELILPVDEVKSFATLLSKVADTVLTSK